MTKIKGEDMNVHFPFPAILVRDESNNTANLWYFLQKSSSDWPTDV